jgi:hypothetical protein
MARTVLGTPAFVAGAQCFVIHSPRKIRNVTKVKSLLFTNVGGKDGCNVVCANADGCLYLCGPRCS